MARFDPGYSFRSSDFNGDQEQQGRPCTRGDYCASRTVQPGPDGTRQITPGLTWRTFCEADRSEIRRCLENLPAAYGRLAGEIGERSQRQSEIRSPLGPRTPLREDVDALMRLVAETLASWEERVRDAARLSVLDTHLSRHRDAAPAVRAAAVLLSAHLDPLLALSPGPMMRAPRDAVVIAELGGADAGMEILSAHHKCLAVLGETRVQAEILEGVPCRAAECEQMALERAEPPSDPAQEAMHSRCAACHDTMTLAEFRAWSKWYSQWADSSGITCRRCQLGRHDECKWSACSCKACRHLAA